MQKNANFLRHHLHTQYANNYSASPFNTVSMQQEQPNTTRP